MERRYRQDADGRGHDADNGPGAPSSATAGNGGLGSVLVAGNRAVASLLSGTSREGDQLPLEVQRSATVLQRQGPPGGAPTPSPSVASPPVAGDGLTEEQRRQLLQASTTLRAVQPLSPDDNAVLRQVIPGAGLLDLVSERDTKRGQLADRTADLERMRDQQAHPPENGAPPNQDMVNEAAKAVADLTAEVSRLDGLIQAGLAPLGIANEHDLAALVSDRFPRLFLERGKQIALAELGRNQEIVDRETQRYGLNACVDPAARQSLVAAAADLVARDQRIEELQRRIEQVRPAVDLPSGGVPDPGQMGSSYADLMSLNNQLQQAGAEREQQRQRYALQHPVLLRGSIDLRAIASGNTAAFDAQIGGELTTIAANIADTRGNIESGRLKIWNLNNIVQMTSQDLGVSGQPALQTAISQYIQREQADEAMVHIAVAALAITAGIVATLATGGVALAAGGVMLGASGYQAAESVRNYLAEGAAGNVALDPAVADISKREPELGWLLLDLVSVGLDAVQVVHAFNELRQTARAASEAGAVVEFADQARRVLPPAAAERVVASITRQKGTKEAVGRVVEAIGERFRHADLADIARHLEEVADKGYKAMVDNLRSQGRIRPLTREAMEEVYHGEELTAKLAAYLSHDGIYDPIRGWLWVKPGGFEEVASTVVHETTHWLQTTQHAGMTVFMEEFQAFVMEQRYLRSLLRSAGGDLNAVPDSMLWLLSASEERIAQHVIENYPAAVRVTEFDAERAAEDALRRLEVFH